MVVRSPFLSKKKWWVRLFFPSPRQFSLSIKAHRQIMPSVTDVILMSKPTNNLTTFYIRTYGCQMNELDSEIIIGQLEKRGLKRVYRESEGDILLFNTCSIRDLAERKVMGKIGQLSRSFPKKLIGVMGCMATAKKEDLFRKLPNIDFVVGPNNISDLHAILNHLIKTGEKQIKADLQFAENLNYLAAKRNNKHKAYVSIIRGCNKFCTYCVVPYTRGREVSRPSQDIEEECRLLVSQGYKEITLLGQNVNSYGKDKPEWGERFHDLLYRLDKIDGLKRLRFMTSHPIDIQVELMQAMRDLPSLCESIHFPIQSGSNRILKMMHRMYSKEEYFAKVTLLKSIIPNISLGTDIIVGFPTESEEDFEETLNVFRHIRYSIAFCYTYSPRKGTPAIRWGDTVPRDVKESRLQRLMFLHESICAQERKDFIGKEVEVLVEEQNKEGLLKGRTRCWKKVIFSGADSLIGTFQTIKLYATHHQTLIGKRVVNRNIMHS